MTTAKQDAMIWMNANFGADISAETSGTPISRNLIIAIGIQETYYLWANMYKTSTPEEVLAVCVGDTIDYPERKTAWPKNRAELEAHPKGKEMFKIARKALEGIAKINTGYRRAFKNKDKFCHGFGMFQYDIQYFKDTDPDYFLSKKWSTWKGTLGKGVDELKEKITDLYGPAKQILTHNESVCLAIAYNQGAKRTRENMAKRKFKQGHVDDNGVFYGEHIDANLKAMKGLF